MSIYDSPFFQCVTSKEIAFFHATVHFTESSDQHDTSANVAKCREKKKNSPIRGSVKVYVVVLTLNRFVCVLFGLN